MSADENASEDAVVGNRDSKRHPGWAGQDRDDKRGIAQERPERGEIVFSAIFDEQFEERFGTLTEEETSLLQRVIDTMERTYRVLEIDEGRAYSFDEISELVNDPFPASLVVRPGGVIVELQGFIREPDSENVRVPRASLWTALESLDGRWLTPDPLVAMFDTREEESPDESHGSTFAQLPRRATPPDDWNEIKSALEEQMSVPSTLRVAWIKE